MPVESARRQRLRRSGRYCCSRCSDECDHRRSGREGFAHACFPAQGMEGDERPAPGGRVGRNQQGVSSMKEFNYHRPTKAAEAVSLIKKARNGKLMSGGMTLIPTMKQGLASPSDIIDLGGVKNSGITATAGKVSIKAGTTHTQVAESDALKKTLPALATVAGGIGDPHVRNKGTIGGSIANNDPAADYPAAVVGLGATVITNGRKIAGDKFFTGMFTTALKREEIVTAVEFPVPQRWGARRGG